MKFTFVRLSPATPRRHGAGTLPALALLLALSAAGGAQAIPCLSGFVRDGANQPVAGGDLDFNISATGQRIVTPGDNTDAAGFYSVCVLPGIYDVAFAPGPGSRLMGRLIAGVDLTADVGVELDVILATGTVLSGVVRDPLGQPVGNVDLDVDLSGAGRIYTPGDNSDPTTGAYRVVIPDGLHRLRWSPPRGSRLRGLEIDGVVVTGDQVRDVSLVEGLFLRGRVTDTGSQGAFDVEIDLRRLDTGAKVFLANRATDVAGDYVVSAPAGDFELRYVPPRSSHLVAVAVDSLALSGDLVRDQQLATGHRLVVEIRNADGQPLAGADLDVRDPVTGAKLFTPHDTSDPGGLTVAALPAGVYDLDIQPPLGASLAPLTLTGYALQGDATVVVQLEAEARVSVSGRVVDQDGAGVGGAEFRLRQLPAGVAVALGTATTAVDGSFALDVPTGRLEVLVAPPAGSRLVGLRLPEITVTGDSLWGDLVLAAGRLVQVAVTDADGAPVAGADLDLVELAGGQPVYTPRDNTDVAGNAVLAAPDGTYALVVTPAAGSSLRAATVSPVTIAADTTLTVVLERAAAGGGPVVIEAIWPNPATGPTRIAFSLVSGAETSLAIHDARGRLVRTLSGGFRQAGLHEETWDGTSNTGARAPSGVYFVHLRTPHGESSRRLALIH
jgi:hypothetical protein